MFPAQNVGLLQNQKANVKNTNIIVEVKIVCSYKILKSKMRSAPDRRSRGLGLQH